MSEGQVGLHLLLVIFLVLIKGRSLLPVRVRMLMVLFRLRLKIGTEAKSAL